MLARYEDALFQQHVLDFVAEHDPAAPMFLFWAPHIVHTPLQVHTGGGLPSGTSYC